MPYQRSILLSGLGEHLVANGLSAMTQVVAVGARLV